MATLSLSIPTKGLTSPTNWNTREKVVEIMANIEAKYGKYFKFASETSRIPKIILMSFCAVESGGKPSAGSDIYKTQGLMQWNRKHAGQQLEEELAQGRMSAAEKSKLAEYGIKFDAKGKTREITNADQLKPELNILIGSIVMGQLIDKKWGNTGGNMHLDRVIVCYNSGEYTTSGKMARSGDYKTPQSLSNALAPINETSSDYIKKIMGKNGALDVAMTELKGKIA